MIFLMNKNQIIGGIIVLVIGSLILTILSVPVKNFLDPPKATPLVSDSYNEKFCPAKVQFSSYGDKTSPFEVKLQNDGDDGVLYVRISSDQLLTISKDEDTFKATSQKKWIMDSEEYQEFNFELKRKKEEETGNITIKIEYGCYENIWGRNFYCDEKHRCCNYAKKDNTYYELINEKCSAEG